MTGAGWQAVQRAGFFLAEAAKARHYFGVRGCKMISQSAVGLLALLSLTAVALGQPVTMTYPEAVLQLTSERTRAETCVALLKKHGNETQVSRGQLTYTNAKADADGVIAGLIVALSAGQQPASLSSLQANLSSSHTSLADFCGSVDELVPKTPGQRDIVTDIAKATILPLLNMLSAAVSTLYGDHRNDDVLTRRTIQTQLEAARWPAFSEVKAAQ
jgi:hypothetical protein